MVRLNMTPISNIKPDLIYYHFLFDQPKLLISLKVFLVPAKDFNCSEQLTILIPVINPHFLFLTVNDYNI